jgi:hypothetical protein
MNKLVAVRIADSKEGLARIDEAVKQTTNRRKEAVRLAHDLRNLYQVSAAIGSLEALVSQAKKLGSLRGLEPDIQKLLKERTSQADEGLTELKTQLENLQDRALELTQCSFNEGQIREHEKLTSDIVKNKARELDDVPSTTDPNGNPKAASELLALVSSIQPLWAEHIEAVAGLVLRDDRFDFGLSKYCDQIVDLCRKTPFALKKTLNVLGRDQAILKDVNWAVFLRFPAWTIWALSLIAHEFWHAASRELPNSKGLAQRLGKFANWAQTWNDPIMQDCLADAFGTYVIGPAYAFACVLLILDANSPTDQLRAGTIFATINRMVSKGSVAYGFAHSMEQSWQDASPAPAAAGAPPSTLPDPALIASYVTAVTDFLRDDIAYNEEVWKVVGSQITNLLKAEQDEASWLAALPEEWEPGTDIRHVLHAGWAIRWDLPDQDKAKVDRLGKRVELLCDVVGKLKQPLAGTEDAA